MAGVAIDSVEDMKVINNTVTYTPMLFHIMCTILSIIYLEIDL